MNEHRRTPTETGALLEVGELVILADGQRAIVRKILPGPTELHYSVEMPDATEVEVEAGGLIKAETYASWVAPGSGWDGRERRGPDRMAAERSVWNGEERRRP